MRTSPFYAAKRKQHGDSFSTVMFNYGRRNTGLPLKFKDVLSMILFLNEEVTYTRACFKTIKLTKAKCKREKQPHESRRLFSHTA